MMMKMLEAGGLPILSDNLRQADADNPEGYYELERVKKLSEGDTGWLGEAMGHAVKVISTLLKYLPREYTYKVILLRRDMAEILVSQQKMLSRRDDSGGTIHDSSIAEIFENHLAQVQAWMEAQPNISVLELDYSHLVQAPEPDLRQVCEFLDRALDVEKMANVVNPDLYRNRMSET